MTVVYRWGIGVVIRAMLSYFYIIFFFNDTATTEIYTLSLHDALPIYWICRILILIIVLSLLRLLMLPIIPILPGD